MAEEMTAEQAVRRAKQLSVLTLIAVIVSCAILAIDQGIKRAILAEADKARLLLAEVKKHAEEMSRNERTAEAAAPGDTPGPGVDPGNGVVRDATAGAALAETVGPAKAAPRQRPARVQSRPPGDG